MNKLILAACAALLAACASMPESPRRTGAEIDAFAARAMAATSAKGMAIAVIENGQVTHVGAYGLRNEKGEPLTPDTVMYGASLTKAVFGYTAMQLVEAGKLDLDRPIAAYLPKPLPEYGADPVVTRNYADYSALADDPRWRAITPRMALSHTTGFANFFFLEPDERARIHFDPGTRYAYSGDGMLLLQLAIEKGIGVSVGAMTDETFKRLGMTRTSLIWRPDFATNMADGWTLEGRPVPHDDRSRVRVSGSMDTTIADFAKFAAAYVRGDGVSRASRAELVRSQIAITSRYQFPTLNDALQLPPDQRRADFGSGLGVVVFDGPQGPAFSKGGHDDQTGNSWVCVERGKRCIVILANDVRAEAAFPAITRFILGETGVPYDWTLGEMAFWRPEP
jgi:CubicO group peptidase (beta-lactamase class C family)